MFRTFTLSAKRVFFTFLIPAALATTAFALPGSMVARYMLDYRSGPVDANISSIETTQNGKLLLFGWERFTVGRETLPKPTIRRDYDNSGPLPGIGCVRNLPALWGAYLSSAVQADGKYLIAGYTFERYTPNFRRLLVVRCNQDLSLDTDFGNGGVLISQFGPGMASYGYGVFTRPDGKIVVAGSYSENAGNYQPAAAQYNADGTPDSSFGIKGVALIAHALSRHEVSAALQADGKIVVAGTNSGVAFALSRISIDGSEDFSFGSGQPVRTVIGSDGVALAEIKLQTDGKVVAAGTASSNTDSDVALARYNTDGSLDNDFGGAGIVVSDMAPGEIVSALALQPNGKILAGGQNQPAGSSKISMVARFFPNGAVDREFGRGGIANSDGKMIQDIKTAPDNKFIAAGSSAITPFAARHWGTERNSIPKFDFDGDGKSDLGYFDPVSSDWHFSYSGGGVSTIKWGLPTDTLAPADYDGDGKMNLAVFRNGDWHILSSDGTFYTVPFGQEGDLPRPGDFDSDGKADFAVFRPSNGLWLWRESSTGFTRQRYFGMAGDVPVAGDYNGDGKSEIAVYRPSTATWYIFNPDTGFTSVDFGSKDVKPLTSVY